jgi:hypothetical protein
VQFLLSEASPKFPNPEFLMIEPMPNQADLLSRIAELERRQRAMRPVTVLALGVALAALVAFAWRPPEVLQAQRLELVSPQGQQLATLAGDSAGVMLTLLDKRGRARAGLRLNGEPRVLVLDDTGDEVAGLGAPRPRHLVQ